MNEKKLKYNREFYIKNKERLLEYQKERYKKLLTIFQNWRQTLSCSVCNEKETVCLEFHHYSDEKKEGNVIHMVTRSAKAVARELEKCIVVCANCHRKIHFKNIPFSYEEGELSESFMKFHSLEKDK